MTTDASLLGWGAHCHNCKIGWPWSEEEKLHHINYLKLLGAFLAVKSFCRDRKNITVHLKIDNSSAIAYINHLGGTRSTTLCVLVVRELWAWCLDRKIVIASQRDTLSIPPRWRGPGVLPIVTCWIVLLCSQNIIACEKCVHMPLLFTVSFEALTAPQDIPNSRGNSDRGYFQTAPEMISEGLKSKILLGEHVCYLPIESSSSVTRSLCIYQGLGCPCLKKNISAVHSIHCSSATRSVLLGGSSPRLSTEE